MENLLFTGAMEIQIFLLNLELYIKQKLLTNAIWGKTSAILVWASLKFARTMVSVSQIYKPIFHYSTDLAHDIIKYYYILLSKINAK